MDKKANYYRFIHIGESLIFRLRKNSKLIIDYAKNINRTPNAIYMKIQNLINVKTNGEKGLPNYSKLDVTIVNHLLDKPNDFNELFENISEFNKTRGF